MPEIIGKYDIKVDSSNRWQAANLSTNSNWVQFMPKEDQEMVAKLKWLTEKEAENIMKPYLEKKYQQNKENMDDAVEKMINRDRLDTEKLTRHSIEYEMFTIYLTTLNRCPYNWHDGTIWMVDSRSPEYRSKMWRWIFAHELLHMQTHKYYENVEPMSRLSPKQFNDLKESLTFLLNHEFDWIDMREDKWYPQHQELRKVLEDHRLNSDKDFEELIAFWCNYLLKNNK